MTKTSRCANCGAELADDAVDGQCPRCLLRLALAPPGETGAATGEIFGPYRTIRVLGEGGMGIVYLAEQDQPIHRLVALKVIKLGMDTEEVIARFESEPSREPCVSSRDPPERRLRWTSYRYRHV